MIKFCSLFSGSSGNAIFVEANGTKLLFDAGLSGVKIEKALKSIGEEACDLSAIFVSHEHNDHVRGVGVLTRRYGLRVYANENTWDAMAEMIGKVDPENVCTFVTGESVRVGSAVVETFPTPHDAAESVGFRITDGNKKIAIATDIGHMTDCILDRLTGCELVLLESNHDIRMLDVGPYPYHLKRRIKGDYGHLSNDVAGQTAVYLAENGTKRIFLGHLSHENNYPELALITTQNCFKKCLSEDDCQEVCLSVARRDATSEVIDL